MVAQDKIAYVNADEIYSKMPELKEVETKLAAKGEVIKKNIAAIEKEFNDKVEIFRTDTTGLSEAIILDRNKQLEDLRARYETFVQSSNQDMEKEHQTLVAPVQEKLRNAIKAVGDENGYTYIFNAGALLHVGSSAVDAGPKVKTKLGITN
jgi:outer membrane protein